MISLRSEAVQAIGLVQSTCLFICPLLHEQQPIAGRAGNKGAGLKLDVMLSRISRNQWNGTHPFKMHASFSELCPCVSLIVHLSANSLMTWCAECAPKLRLLIVMMFRLLLQLLSSLAQYLWTELLQRWMFYCILVERLGTRLMFPSWIWMLFFDNDMLHCDDFWKAPIYFSICNIEDMTTLEYKVENIVHV